MEKPPASNKTPGTVTAALSHSQTEFGGPFNPIMIMSLGNPPQVIKGIFDTGSADLIVPEARRGFCKQPTSDCEPVADGGNGSFDPKQANVTETGTELRTGFANGETEEGRFVTTSAEIGGVQIKTQKWGMIVTGRPGPDSPDASLKSIVGVSSVLAEAESTETYPNIPAQMKLENKTMTLAFCVFLNDFRGPDGSVTFGGVDKAKFKGELKSAPMVDTPPSPDDQGGDGGPPGNQDQDEKHGAKGDGQGGGGGGGRKVTDSRAWRGWRRRGARMRVLTLNKKQESSGQDGKNPKKDGKDPKDGNDPNEDGSDPKKDGNGPKKDGNKDPRIDFFIELSSVSHVPPDGGESRKGYDRGNADGKNRQGRSIARRTGMGGEDKNGSGQKDAGKDAGNGPSRNETGKNADKGNGGGQGQVGEGITISLMPNGMKVPALIDTGNPLCQVPEVTARNLAKVFGVEFNQTDGTIGSFDCAKAVGSMRFGFNNDTAILETPVEMLLIPKKLTRSAKCDLAIMAGDVVSLGAACMQGGYVCFDDDNKQLLFAQAAINSTRSDIEAVGPDSKYKMKGTG